MNGVAARLAPVLRTVAAAMLELGRAVRAAFEEVTRLVNEHLRQLRVKLRPRLIWLDRGRPAALRVDGYAYRRRARHRARRRRNGG